jgi:aspartate/methionine/tyrosine aminotransferase
MSKEYQDITQHEIEALKFEYNLADAHTHQSQSPSQMKIVNSLPKIWLESEKKKQAQSEEDFINTFFEVQRQKEALKTPTMLVYAASIAMVITANYLMRKKMSVALIDPCFDNIHDILKNMEVPMDSLQEEWLHDPASIYENLKNNIKADALFIVDPNNPTGFTLTGTAQDAELTKQGFLEVFRYAKDHNKLLIFDFCFASFLLPGAELGIFEIYKYLEESGVSYIAMEDTGKTWPLQDAKVAMLKTSKNIHDEVYNIYTSYLLNVSPFILNVVTEYIRDSQKDYFASVVDLLKRNRDITRDVLAGSLLELVEPKSNVSVAWLKIKDPTILASDLQQVILKEGVYVLPGTYFFWSDRSKGEHYIRLALARNTEIFEPALKLIRQALDKYESKTTN